MKVVESVAAMQRLADEMRCTKRRLALVPTMGALHEGHLALVRKARELADHVTVSIFVNPTQFGPREDYSQYPRPLDDDLEALEREGADIAFIPATDEMYPDGQSSVTWVTVERLTEHLCGAFRDGHFRGVTTVVTKLFNSCKPDLAVFGLKDAQQFLVLRRLVRDLNLEVELHGVPTVREPDGLALSSRNVFLDTQQRKQAVRIHQGLQAIKMAVEVGERRASTLIQRFKQEMKEASEAQIQYIEVVDTDNIQPIENLEKGQEILVATAVFFGNTRLIDNLFITVPLDSR